MERRRTVIIVSHAQPSANPRIIKEMVTLLNREFQVTILWCPISPWADEFDQQLFRNYPQVQWIQAGYHHERNQIGFYYARIRQQIWKLIFRFIGNVFDAALKSQVLFSQELIKKAKTINADLYIGHNLGALPAIVKAAKLHKAKSIFDFEDFHRGEHSPESIPNKAFKSIENKYIPQVQGISASSSLIAEAYKNIFTNKKIITLNNVFPLSLSVKAVVEIADKPLKLFWFSQYIGKKRGLETILKAMTYFKNNQISLTLLGKLSGEMENYFKHQILTLGLNTDQVIFMDPVQESSIPEIASAHHIGIASEPGRDVNNELALSNKIMIYMLSGNAILFSNTKAQSKFFEENPKIGFKYEKENHESLTSFLQNYLSDPSLLNDHRMNSLNLGKNKFNWDYEKTIFFEHVSKVLAP